MCVYTYTHIHTLETPHVPIYTQTHKTHPQTHTHIAAL
jgi:hypothetical protein